MEDWPPRLLREEELQKTETHLERQSGDVEARFRRCCLLAELGRKEEARDAYLELLKLVPTHLGALIQFGNLVYSMGFKSAAITLYSRAIELYPDEADPHVNLANLLAENQIDEARRHY
ncbi:MAG TPA: tetratricopeptide repeat protein, partial [Tepidisphaeraceae bacterium]|nr:tetratricopeptide repeat protein [Tepidisphaeraceae bacterium]